MFELDPIAASIAIGLAVSLLFTEVFGLAAGGMVVPGYLALSLNRPLDIALTLGAALLTYGIVKCIARFSLVYGRRRIVLMLLIGFIIGSAIRAAPVLAGSLTPQSFPAGQSAAVIGFIIPGLIALWFDRQGVVETGSVLLTTSAIVRMVLILVGMEALT